MMADWDNIANALWLKGNKALAEKIWDEAIDETGSNICPMINLNPQLSREEWREIFDILK